MTFTRAITHQKPLAQSGRSTQSAVDISIHSAYLLKSQSENKKLSWSVWILINVPPPSSKACVWKKVHKLGPVVSIIDLTTQMRYQCTVHPNEKMCLYADSYSELRHNIWCANEVGALAQWIYSILQNGHSLQMIIFSIMLVKLSPIGHATFVHGFTH